MNCELCGKDCTNEFGDVGGAIVCPACLGWYGHTPDSSVTVELARLEKEGEST